MNIRSFVLACLALMSFNLITRGEQFSLGNGHIQFTPPPDAWAFTNLADHGTAAVYKAASGHGLLLLSYVANKAPKPEQEEPLRTEILKSITAHTRQKDAQVVTEPRLENNGRFFVEVFEQWRKEGKLTSQWHIYQNLPPHQAVVTALVVTDDEKEIAQTKEAAEALAAGVRLVPAGTKAPAEPTLAKGVKATPEPQMVKMTTDVEAAQKDLDEVMAKSAQRLEKDPKFGAAKKAADAAEAKLKALRSADPPDRAAIGEASRAWIEAKSEVESIRKEALASDGAVIEVKKRLDAARQASK
jgi:hypothetical protein